MRTEFKIWKFAVGLWIGAPENIEIWQHTSVSMASAWRSQTELKMPQT